MQTKGKSANTTEITKLLAPVKKTYINSFLNIEGLKLKFKLHKTCKKRLLYKKVNLTKFAVLKVNF